jgi:hydrogenase-4 component B
METVTASSAVFVVALVLYLAGATIPLALRRGREVAAFLPAAMGSALVIVFAVSVILSGSIVRISSPLAAPVPALDFSLYIDGVAAFFMLIIGLVALAVSIYSIGYSESYHGAHSIGALGFLVNLFVVSMLLVTATDSVFSFLVFWELMSLSSFFLVVFEHEKPENLRSGVTYLVMTHIGTAFITAAFLLLFLQTGSLSFDSFRGAAAQLPALTKDAVFVLALLGFGTKAGLVPMHIWLPKAHPAAPSNVSALMSGVMLKVAIYGLARVTLGFVLPDSPGDAWLGLLMVSAGSASALFGVLFAAVEHDIKRALAYHSVENIGIIVTGLGLSVVFMSYGLETLAALALLASMYHSLNHAIFKGLLFMAAGSVVQGAGTADMNLMGGLAKRMPWTSLFFLVGSIAIAGLPPLNGFVSEWLTLQALLSSYQVPNVALQLSIGFASIVFALTLGLALATFVKLFGISFLARPRSEGAESAAEAPRTMLAGMGLAGAICVLLGVLPFVATSLISSFFGFDVGLVGGNAPFGPLTVGYAAGRSLSALSPPEVIVAAASVGAALLGFTALASRGRQTVVRPYPTWEGGFGPLGVRTEYTASSLSQPIRTAFKWFYRPHTSTERTYFSDSDHMVRRSVSVRSETKELFEAYLYSPTTRAVVFVMDKVRKIQTGKINSYLLYVMIVTASLLLLAALQP